MEKTTEVKIKDTQVIPVYTSGEPIGHYIITSNEENETPEKKTRNWKDIASTHKGIDVFAIFNGKCISMNVKTDMEHRLYFKKKFGVSQDTYNNLIRGYMRPGQIIFYMSAGFTKIDDIPGQVLETLIIKALELFGNGEYKIYKSNGGKLELLDYKFAYEEASGFEDKKQMVYFLKPSSV